MSDTINTDRTTSANSKRPAAPANATQPATQAQAVARAARRGRRGGGRGLRRVLLHGGPISRVDRRRLRQRQPRATDAASERHGRRGQRRRHADRQAGRRRSSRSIPPIAKIALPNAEATLGQTVRQVSGLYVNNDFYAATVAQRESDLARANDDLKRRQRGGRHRRGVRRRHRARPRRGQLRASRARRRAPAGRSQPCADRPHVDRTASERAGRRRRRCATPT